MEQDREVDRVLMNIRNSSGDIVSLALLSVQMNLKMLTFFMRLAKKALIPNRSVDAYKGFLQKSEGNYTVYNIPLSNERLQSLQKLNELEVKLENARNPIARSRLQSEIKREMKKLEKQIPEFGQLRRLGIEYCILPYLNTSEQAIQIAVSNKDSQLFKNWFLNYLMSKLHGGKKEMGELRAFTEGNYSIFNLPFEGQELQEALQDFDLLGINYSILPDLNVGDGYSQVAIPNADRGKLESWFQMWRDKQLQQGKEPGIMYAIDQESYIATGSRSQDEYIAGADQKYQEVNAEFEKQSTEVPWRGGMRKENSEEFVRYLNDQNFEKISINKETLVEDMTMLPGVANEMREKGFFVSRIPGTYGSNQELLVVPLDRAFIADDGKTYIVFLPKNEPTLVSDIAGDMSKRNFSEVYKPYSRVDRGFQGVQNAKEKGMDKAKNVKQGMGNASPKKVVKPPKL